ARKLSSANFWEPQCSSQRPALQCVTESPEQAGERKMPRTKQNNPKNLKDKIEEAQKELKEPRGAQT
ncbi:zinc finger protein 40 isoform X1, partial [Clarias magur]